MIQTILSVLNVILDVSMIVFFALASFEMAKALRKKREE